jgi:adenine phosphoribosyltransferase
MDRLRARVRAVEDFPKTGIVFRDLTPLFADAEALEFAIDRLAEPFRKSAVDRVAAVEARGFIVGALVARKLEVGFVPLRKPGKLPRPVESVCYDLEYGSAVLEAHTDAIAVGERILVVDDVLATGGTAAAAATLVRRLGGEVVAFAMLLELSALGGRDRLFGEHVHSVMTF